MKNQLIPPPELAPPSIRHLAPDEKVALWAQMVDEGDQMVIAGLQRRLGPHGDVEAAFLAWLDRRTAEHDRALVQMLKTLHRGNRSHGQ